MRPVADFGECWLELHCCKGTVMYPVKLLLARGAIGRLAAVRPGAVFLCETPYRKSSYGPAPGWSVELTGGVSASGG